MNLLPSANCLARAWRGATVFAMPLLYIGLFASPTQAVTITGSTYASDTGDPNLPASPQSKSFNIFNPTTASSSIRSDVTTSHAQSLASASIVSGTLVKSTSGRGWVDTVTPAYNNRGDLWNASASGTKLILNGPPGGTAQFKFFIPGATPDPTIPFPSILPTDPATMQPASGQQGFFANNGNSSGAPATLPAFFDEYLHVDASIDIGATNFFHFSGDLIYNPGDNSIIGTGDFLTLAQNATKSVIPNNLIGPIYAIHLPDFSALSADVPANTEFDAVINMSMSMGDPTYMFNGGNNGSPPPSNFPSGFLGTDTTGLPSGAAAVGAGGSFAAEFSLIDPTHQYSLEVVPEPSSLLLAAIGLAAALGIRRRLSTR